MRKLRLALLALFVVGGALSPAALDADGESYSVSLNSPAKFPVDI